MTGLLSLCLGLLFTALHAEPLAPELLTPYKCAWLEIPHTPYSVLISVNGNESTPWVKTLIKEEDRKHVLQIKTNFSFVDPSLYDAQTRQYKKLPEGLYHWKDDATLLAGQELKRLAHKANSNVGENNYLVRPFPKRLTGFALNTAASEYINLLANSSTWHPTLVKNESFNVLGRLIADMRLPKWDPESFEFTIASNNTLFSVSSKGNSCYKGALSAEKREKLFNELFNDEGALADSDILCFQESTKLPLPTLEKNGYEIIQDAKNIGLTTAVNPNKFEILEHETINFSISEAQHRGFMVVVLETKELESNKRLGIVNLHAMGGPGSKAVPYRALREQQLQQVVKTIKQKNSVSHWILCGDFNIDGFDPALYQMTSEMLSVANLTLNPNTSNKPSAVTTTKDGERLYKQIDYIMVTPTFTVSTCMHHPEDQEQLLAQNPEDSKLHYHSDHAIIKTTLSFSDDDMAD